MTQALAESTGTVGSDQTAPPQAVLALLRTGAQSGTHYHWRVTDPDVHVYGNTACIAYVNSGIIVTPGSTTSRQWLESAYLVRSSGAWKIAFWHSTRVNPQK